MIRSQSVVTYRLKYNDCSNPTNIERLSVYTVCEEVDERVSEKEEYTILQKMRNKVMKGHKCQVKRSKWTLYCGAFSHEKMIEIPQIEINQKVTISQCENMISTNTFVSEYGSTHGVALNEETVFSVNERGVTHTESSGKVWCQGQQIKIGDVVIDDVLVLSQYRITLETEEFLTHSQAQGLRRVEALNDHVKLPRKCAADHHGCMTASWTYIWNPAPIKCPLMKIQEGSFSKENGHLVEHDLKLLFKVTAETSGVPGCPPGKVLYTDSPEIVLTKQGGFPWIDRQLDLAIYSDQKDDYVMFIQEQAAGKLRNSLNRQLCNTKYSTLHDEIVHLHEQTFSKRRGDILYTFTCPQKIGKVIPMKDTCLNKVPLETSVFVDPVTKIGSKHASKVDCANHFPLTVLSEDGWITVSLSHLQPAIAPQEVKMEGGKLKHESMKKGGLYRHEALMQFEEILEYGSFHQALMETFSSGICRKQGGPCTQARESLSTYRAPIYDISKLEEMVEEEFSLFQSIDEFITKKGGYLALTVIIGWTIQILIAGGMVIMTAIQDGMAACIAALYAVACILPHTVEKVRRQAARRRTVATAPDEETAPMCMKPM